MNIVQKIAVSTIALTSIATPATAVMASANGGAKASKSQAWECKQIARKQQRIVDHIWFGSKWQLKQFQNQTNKLNAENCLPKLSTAQYLERFGNFESLTAALKYTNLYGALDGPGTFTVFAPTDDAFAKLPAGLVNSLLTDPAQKAALTDILKYHVVAGAKVNASTAKTLSSATMLSGDNVAIKVENGKLFINNSQVVLYDIQTTNGVIHVIDTVLVPSS